MSCVFAISSCRFCLFDVSRSTVTCLLSTLGSLAIMQMIHRVVEGLVALIARVT